MKKLLIGMLLLGLVAGCENHKEEPSSVSRATSEKITFPTFPNFPTLPKPPGGTVTVTTPVTSSPATSPATDSVKSNTENCSYAGRYNGDRATWYCSNKMASYPSKLTIIIPECITKTISNNGSRYDSGGLIVKQSEVSGRGMAIVIYSSCKSKTASIKY